MDPQVRSIPSDEELDRMQWVADPFADDTLEAIVGPSPTPAERILRIKALNEVLQAWDTNEAVANWRPGPGTPVYLAAPLQRYVSAAGPLPPWADRESLGRADDMFMDYGALSVTTLFCASLPESYVVPDLAAVLHATGQLVHRVDHRIRATGGMIFPVLMRGGLTDPQRSGISQVLKVRLIHAAVRNLLLRDSPQVAVARMATVESAGVIAPLSAIEPCDPMHESLFKHGWNLKRNGLPNNQEELLYTLLSFSHVFPRSMRRLGIAFTPQEERDYLHVWNVAGHFLGIRHSLMVHTPEDAEVLFARLQARGRAELVTHPMPVDPRPELGVALMDAMASAIPPGPWRSFPILLTRYLIEPDSARDLGLKRHTPWVARLLFAALMILARGLDALIRLAFPDFSLCRLITRAIGYRLTCALLMNETRELVVPARLRPEIHALIASWGTDAHAPDWMNALEDRFTIAGDWHKLKQPPPRRTGRP